MKMRNLGLAILFLFQSVALVLGSSAMAAAPFCGDLLDVQSVQATTVNARAVSQRPLSSIQDIKVLTYNVDMFGIDGHKPGVIDINVAQNNWKAQGIGKIIRDAAADVIILQEVRGTQSIDKFIRDHLNDEYRFFMMRGNDKSGSEIGFLVKKDLPFDVRIKTHRDLQWTDPQTNVSIPVFSRDLPVLEFRLDPKDADPFLVVVGNHAKAKRDMPGDPESLKYRTQQYVEAAKIIQGIRAKGIPVIMGGDFNSDIRRDKEVAPVKALLQSSLDIAPDAIPADQRTTQTFHPQDGPTVLNQFDDLLVSPDLIPAVKSSRIIRYKDSQGVEMAVPMTFQERRKQPSDHFPVLLRVLINQLFKSSTTVQP